MVTMRKIKVMGMVIVTFANVVAEVLTILHKPMTMSIPGRTRV